MIFILDTFSFCHLNYEDHVLLVVILSQDHLVGKNSNLLDNIVMLYVLQDIFENCYNF